MHLGSRETKANREDFFRRFDQVAPAASLPMAPCDVDEASMDTKVRINSIQDKTDRRNVKAQSSLHAAGVWLALWFALNMSVTLINKRALYLANLPVTLTFIHMICNTIGAALYFRAPWTTVARKSLGRDQSKTMFFFSFVFVSNVVTGNWSLGLVSVSFNQVMRALVPGTTLLLSIFLLKSPWSTPKALALLPIGLGVYLACVGDKSSTFLGLTVTIAAVILAALKAVLSSKFLTGAIKMHPADLILHQAPLSAVWCAVAIFVCGEWDSIFSGTSNENLVHAMSWYFLTGVLSFALNLTSFFANRATSALTLAVCANIKQVVVIALSVYLHGDHMTIQTVFGVFLVTVGGAAYALQR
ncbi:hypothetical protein AeNC1_000146 [Aphanomyces euteiches]|nr:hypothetical protein AeNC1_000146 [Aphanomyces euteiches]